LMMATPYQRPGPNFHLCRQFDEAEGQSAT
jgi:hypothetical protein